MTLLARRILSSLAVSGTFVVAYFASATVWFPGVLASSSAAVKVLFPPSLEHSSEPTAHPPGTSIDLPVMIPLSGEGAFTPPDGPIAVTVFDVSCKFSGKSVPFWRRANAALVKVNVPTVFAACAPTLDEARSFAGDNEMDIPLYYAGDCAEVAPRLKLDSKILQYVLDERRRVVSAWGGMPLYRYAENNVIAQMVAAATITPR